MNGRSAFGDIGGPTMIYRGLSQAAELLRLPKRKVTPTGRTMYLEGTRKSRGKGPQLGEQCHSDPASWSPLAVRTDDDHSGFSREARSPNCDVKSPYF